MRAPSFAHRIAVAATSTLVPFTLGAGCGEPSSTSRLPDGSTTAPAAPESSAAPSTTACLRLNTCGAWGGCIAARPQSLPFRTPTATTDTTTGEWYRFDWSDRKTRSVSARRPASEKARPTATTA